VLAAQIDVIRDRVSVGFWRRQDDIIEKIFHKYSTLTDGRECLLEENLSAALAEIKVPFDGDVKKLLREIDAGKNGYLSLDEFKSISKNPTVSERWALSLPLYRLLSDALPPQEKQDDIMRTISALTDQEISLVCEGMLDGLKRMVREAVQILNKAYRSMDSRKAVECGSTKFVVNSMSCGDINDFHAGLEGRIGKLESSIFVFPHYSADPQIF
jgi:hypothetical protein